MAVTRVHTTVVYDIFEVHLAYLDIPHLTTNQIEIISCHELSLLLHYSGLGGYFELEPMGLHVRIGSVYL